MLLSFWQGRHIWQCAVRVYIKSSYVNAAASTSHWHGICSTSDERMYEYGIEPFKT